MSGDSLVRWDAIAFLVLRASNAREISSLPLLTGGMGWGRSRLVEGVRQLLFRFGYAQLSEPCQWQIRELAKW